MSKKTEKGIQVYRRLVKHVMPFWSVFAIGLFATMIGSGIDAGFTWALKPILDKGFIDRNDAFIQMLPILAIAAFVFRGVAGLLSNYCINWVGRSIVMNFRQLLFKKYVHLPTQYYDHSVSGQMLSMLLYNVEQVTSLGTSVLVKIVRQGFLVLGLLAVMFHNNWRLSCTLLIVAPFIAMIVRISTKRLRALSKSIQTVMADVTNVTEETVEAHRVVKTFGGQDYEINKFNRVLKKNFRREMKVAITNSLSTVGVQIMIGLIIAGAAYLITKPAIAQGLTTGSLASLIAAMLALLKPIKILTKINGPIQKGIAAADSIFDVLDMQEEIDNGTVQLQRAQGIVEYKQVSFAYNRTDKPVLTDINFTAQAGETIALVGRSGAGKSSLVSLLSRFYDNYTGQIAIDGIDIRDLKLRNLRRQISLVSQQVTLFNGTIRENIAYGVFSDISDAALEAAAESAHAMEFIRDMPDGIDTLIGENGVLLSGGQRQRIAIARAIIKNSPILILDEATSALDTEAERHIQAALDELMKNRTTLVIAHRLSTIENASRILVLDQGKVVEIGSHDALIARDGHYAKLHRMQFNEEFYAKATTQPNTVPVQPEMA